jgi:D-alanyl-D-alanine dipeptidase
VNQTGIISLQDLRAVPVLDNGEALVDLRTECPNIYFEVAEYLNPNKAEYEDAFFVREKIAIMLVNAQKELPPKFTLLVRCGYRTPKVQARQYKHDYLQLKREHPDWSKEKLDVEIENRTASVDVAPHCTGSAIDLSLANEEGKQLDMGTKIGTFVSETFTHHNNISTQAKKHREILLSAMESVGFVNFPGEWWHFAYGDREWAYLNKTSSIYGPIKKRKINNIRFRFPLMNLEQDQES